MNNTFSVVSKPSLLGCKITFTSGRDTLTGSIISEVWIAANQGGSHCTTVSGFIVMLDGGKTKTIDARSIDSILR